LYNINSAKNFKNKNEEVFIVEGYMDVINLHKFGIQNVVANLGTAMTEKQIELIWRFFKNPVICLDGDVSGQKAAIRAAERMFPLIKSDLNIFFLKLPENLDPDSYINKYGKDFFLKLASNKIDIKDFIWQSYYDVIDKNSPQSLSVFEKKIKSICREIKDKTLSKYFMDYFVKKIDELTPSLNFKKNNFFKIKKIQNPLKQTKETFNQLNQFTEKELKEFSILFLVINNLQTFRKNIESFSEVVFFKDILQEFKQKLIDFMLSESSQHVKKIDIENFDKKFKELISNINDYAPIKIILKNKNENEIFMIFNEVVSEIDKINLKNKIESLEEKVSVNLDEKLYSELLSLRNQLKGG
jgi:DNA primase